MAEVFLSVHGNGTATTDALPPMVDGEPFTITLIPDPGESVDSVRAFDSHDYSVALPSPVNNVISATFRSGWGNLYVDIYFTGSTPPGPGPGPGSFPFWLLAFFKKKKHKKLIF